VDTDVPQKQPGKRRGTGKAVNVVGRAGPITRGENLGTMPPRKKKNLGGKEYQKIESKGECWGKGMDPIPPG